MSYINYAPYFRDGLLYLPKVTNQLLVTSGFDQQSTQDAINGLRLDEDKSKIAELNDQLSQLIETLDEGSVIKGQLTSPEVQFIFTSIEDFEDFALV